MRSLSSSGRGITFTIAFPAQRPLRPLRLSPNADKRNRGGPKGRKGSFLWLGERTDLWCAWYHRRMNKTDLIQEMLDADDRNTLPKHKHSPLSLGERGWTEYRSVLGYEIARKDERQRFLRNGKFRAYEFENQSIWHSPEYYVIEPDSYPHDAASGVVGNSRIATEVLDRLVVVESRDGIHIFGEKWSRILEKARRGRLRMMGEIR